MNLYLNNIEWKTDVVPHALLQLYITYIKSLGLWGEQSPLYTSPQAAGTDGERVQKISPQSCCDSLIVLWCLDNSHLFGFFLGSNAGPPSIAITGKIKIHNFNGSACSL